MDNAILEHFVGGCEGTVSESYTTHLDHARTEHDRPSPNSLPEALLVLNLLVGGFFLPLPNLLLLML